MLYGSHSQQRYQTTAAATPPTYRVGSYDSSSASAASSSSAASDAASSVTGYTTFSQPSSSPENKGLPWASASVDRAGEHPIQSASASVSISTSDQPHPPTYPRPIEGDSGSMNQTQPYMDMPSSHLTSTQPYSSQASSADHVPPYSHYSQPPVLHHHPGTATYGHGTAPAYSAYGYPNNVSSPQSAPQPSANMLSLPPRKFELPISLKWHQLSFRDT